MTEQSTDIQSVLTQAQPNAVHDWLMPSKLVAEGYGCSPNTIRGHKKEYGSELLENQHWLKDEHGHTQWTKRGVIRLGMFIRTDRASLFRDAAEQLVLDAAEGRVPNRDAPALPSSPKLSTIDATAEAIAEVVVNQLSTEQVLQERVNFHVQAKLDAKVTAVDAARLGKGLAVQWGLQNMTALTEAIATLTNQPQAQEATAQ
ncbi:MAG: hypothetical protein HC771_21270 [Synechococcales cyanobacterium CRU_2_2]|nr:hypothetical protein [Synechococcales cyanobacterium CRU_2_2]